MPIRYKIDILAALKDKGYNTNVLRQKRLLSEGTIQRLRDNELVNLATLGRICELLDCQPCDLVEYVKE